MAPRPAIAPGLGHGHVVLADVDAVGAAGADEVGAVVEDEERAVPRRRRRGRARAASISASSSSVLVAELDDAGAPAERGVEERPRVDAAGRASQTK